MTPNVWGVEPGQTWVHPDAVLLVLSRVPARERFLCLILDAEPRSWVYTFPGPKPPLASMTAYVIAQGGKLA